MARQSEDGGGVRAALSSNTVGGRMARCEALLLERAGHQRQQQQQQQQTRQQQQQTQQSKQHRQQKPLKQQPSGAGAADANRFHISSSLSGTGLVSASKGRASSSSGEYLPDSVYTIMLRGYCERRDLAGVSRWLTRLLADRGNDVRALNGETVAAIIRCLCEVGCARMATALEPLLLTTATLPLYLQRCAPASPVVADRTRNADPAAVFSSFASAYAASGQLPSPPRYVSTVFDLQYYQRLLGYAHLLEAFHESAALPAGLAALRSFLAPKPGVNHVDFEFQKSAQYVIAECSPSLRAAWDTLATGAHQPKHLRTIDPKIVHLFQLSPVPSVPGAAAVAVRGADRPMNDPAASLGELQTEAIHSLVAALRPVIGSGDASPKSSSAKSKPMAAALRDHLSLDGFGSNTRESEQLVGAGLASPFAALISLSVDVGSLVYGGAAASAPSLPAQPLHQIQQHQKLQKPQFLQQHQKLQQPQVVAPHSHVKHQPQSTSAAVATVVGGVSAWLSYRASSFIVGSRASQSLGAAIFGAGHAVRAPPPSNHQQPQHRRAQAAMDTPSEVGVAMRGVFADSPLDPFAATLRDELADADDGIESAESEHSGDRDSDAAVDGGDDHAAVPLAEHVVFDPFSDEYQTPATDAARPPTRSSSGRSNTDL